MVTKAKAVDPLIEELPPHVDPAPKSPEDVEFTVLVSPYVVNGQIRWQWEIIEHSHRVHIGDYTGQSATDLLSETEAQYSAKNWVARIRETLQLKLTLPESKVITL